MAANLDVFDVAQSQVFEESIKMEEGLAESWWSAHRVRKDRKYCLAVGAEFDKEPFVEPELPRLALGKAAARPVSSTQGKTSSMREFDQRMMSSELHDYFRQTGYYTRRPFHKKGEHRRPRCPPALPPTHARRRPGPVR